MGLNTDKLFNDAADRTLGMALDFLQSKVLGIKSTGNAANTSNTASTTQSAFMDKLPYILGAAALVGIGIILYKR